MPMQTSESDALSVREMIGTYDILLITLDTLRYDVAVKCWQDGRTPFLNSLLPETGWEPRHTPGSFTFAAHQAFFAGFLPTPTSPGPHPRLFAAAFAGSETTTDRTAVFDAPDIVTGLHDRDYHTICVGGVGFFNPTTPLGTVLPGLFDESYWSRELGVTDRDSTANQVRVAIDAIGKVPNQQRTFLFVNVSALHQPNCHYVGGATEDSPATQAAALEYVDSQLPPLFAALRQRGPVLCVICSDHGTAYGEDGYTGHRLAHPVVWTVPYAEFELPIIS
ncbi:STM4013/SEN3800 family hydrolase [Thalassoroseus pseudoceratinae]|uniref:STM4013/SEN3800 family hydrolase n=1 Tax=Thalassoroseus pseudoceratinae TaxID=2713176 RepID=UPI00142003E4|nr:STM4013/SEN3800 family hydrolase [Thalassoroseus pseudoceratinae]